MPLPNGAVGAACNRQSVNLDDRPNGYPFVSWLADTTGLVDHLHRPDMDDLAYPGAVLITGWIAA